MTKLAETESDIQPFRAVSACLILSLPTNGLMHGACIMAPLHVSSNLTPIGGCITGTQHAEKGAAKVMEDDPRVS